MPSSAAAEAPAAIVSQSEIEQLLSQFWGRENAGGGTSPTVLERADGDGSPRHSFPELSFFSAIELRKLRVRHEELIRFIGAQIASYLRLECVLQMSKLEALPFRKFMNTLADPTHLTLFKLAPLPGTCVMEIPPRLGLCLVDRQLGGPALKVDASRNLSEIEVKLVSRVANLILSDWCSYWSTFLDLKAAIVGHESNSRFVECEAAETIMLVLGITTWVGGEIMDEIQMAFPHYTLEPLVRKIAGRPGREADGNPAPGPKTQWNPSFQDLNLPVSVEFPKLQFSTRRLADLKAGEFIPIAPELSKRVVVRVGGVPKFQGELGAADTHRAVKIAGPISARKR
jgi:flagellar motor switch protein FliM